MGEFPCSKVTIRLVLGRAFYLGSLSVKFKGQVFKPLRVMQAFGLAAGR